MRPWSGTRRVGIQITFRGAAGEVTGSCYEIEAAGRRFLVDCGMVQGDRDADRRNLAALSRADAKLDFVVLTHAHIDHSGLLPRLVKLGFRGPHLRHAGHRRPVHRDAARFGAHPGEGRGVGARPQRHQARRAPRRDPAHDPADGAVHDGRRRAHAAAVRDRPLRRRRSRPRRASRRASATRGTSWARPSSSCSSTTAGVASSSSARATSGSPAGRCSPIRRPSRRPMRCSSSRPTATGCTSTLAQTYDELAAVLTTTLPRGNVIVPAFAVGRTQEVLHVLADLVRADRAPPLSVFVDSPLATKATAITARYASILDRESRDLAAWQAKHPQRMRVSFTETVAGLDGDQRDSQRRGDHRRLRHVRGGPRAPSPAAQPAAREHRHRVHRLPGDTARSVARWWTVPAAFACSARTCRCGRRSTPSAGCPRTPTRPRCSAGSGLPAQAGAHVRRARRAQRRRGFRRAGRRAAGLSCGARARAGRARRPRLTGPPARRLSSGGAGRR